MKALDKYPILVDCNWLEKNLTLPYLRIFDCTVWLKPQHNKIYKIFSGKSDYDKEHIPNSDFLDVLELSNKYSEYDFMMPNLQEFSNYMSLKGVGPHTHVILYSRGNIQWATRVWWMLKSVNFLNVSILNGGFDRWKLENKKVTKLPVKYPENNFKGKNQPGFFCEKEEIIKNIENNKVLIINALRRTLHLGTENINYGRPGHIKNSINIPSTDMINKNTYLYKSIKELKKIFNKYNLFNKDKVITYCGGGIAATNIAFAITIAGF
ncbi:rhodanese-like domain-containing protein, partial [Alphaproteobacteria bacterium]|nr:rhodanese-like domain-containing protein [Alphaproteobacteria bacterium]